MLITANVAYSLEISSQTIGEPGIPTGKENISTVLSTLSAFISLITFRFDNVPIVFNFVFIALGFGVVYIVIDILKDLVPFT